MENTVNNGVPQYAVRSLGWNTKFTLEFKIKKTDKVKLEKAFEGNFECVIGAYAMEGYCIVRMIDMTIKKAYLVKMLLKNINVYE